MTTTKAPVRRKAHRAGPVEVDDVGRKVQTCLRCDRLLYMASADTLPWRVGRRIFMSADCSGALGLTLPPDEDPAE